MQIEHGSICHWVRAAQTIYQITPADCIYQGFSVAFYASLEEIWMAWANGATLVPATPAMAQAGPELPSLLAAAGVVASPMGALCGALVGNAPYQGSAAHGDCDIASVGACPARSPSTSQRDRRCALARPGMQWACALLPFVSFLVTLTTIATSS